jgi:hypothetical protein
MKIYTYRNPNEISKHPNFVEICQYLHICAAYSTYEGIVNRYGNEFEAPIITVGMIFKNLLGHWNSESTKLRQYINLTKCIREMGIENPQYGELIKGIRRNQRDVLSSIRLLIEAGVFPDDFIPTTIEEEAFVKLWTRLECNDDSIFRFRNTFHHDYNNPSSFMSAFKHALNITLENVALKLDDAQMVEVCNGFNRMLEGDLKLTVVLHGFYFITPLQERLFQLMREIGISLIFLNCYDERYPDVFKVWELTFSESKGFPNKQEWISGKGDACEDSWGTLFANIYQGLPSIGVLPVNQLSVIEYEDTTTFIDDYDEKVKTTLFHSPIAARLNRVFREYYPDKYRQKHFLSYPVGQFLYELHRMWNEAERSLVLDMTCLKHSFASGWLRKDGKDARNYLGTLEKLEPYFNGCERLEDWEKRMNELQQFKLQVVDMFEYQGDETAVNARFHRMLANPFLQFSFFRPNVEELNVVVDFIKALIELARFIFGDGGEIDINEHFTKLLEMIESKAPEEELLDEESNLIGELKNRLSIESQNSWKCLPEDISEALMLFLGGEFLDDEDNENNIDDVVKDMDQIDGTSFKDTDLVIHACHLSEESFPEATRSFTWPLTERNLERVKGRPLLEKSLFIVRESRRIHCYLFYYLLAFNKNVSVSWIRDWEEKSLKESPYVQLMRLCHDKVNFIQLGAKHNLGKIVRKEENVNSTLLSQELYSLPDDALIEFQICPRRFFYSYIIQDSPCYLSDFKQQLVFRGLVSALVAATDYSKESVFNEIEKLFPQWNTLAKKQLKEHSKTTRVGSELVPYDGRYYINERLRPHFLKDELYIDYITQQDVDIDAEIDVTSSPLFIARPERESCKYCPHQHICTCSLFHCDENDRR